MLSFIEMRKTGEKYVQENGKKYQLLIFEHVIVYMAVMDLNGDVR